MNSATDENKIKLFRVVQKRGFSLLELFAMV